MKMTFHSQFNFKLKDIFFVQLNCYIFKCSKFYNLNLIEGCECIKFTKDLKNVIKTD